MTVSPSTPSLVQIFRSQHRPESYRTSPQPAGLRTIHAWTASAPRETTREPPASLFGENPPLSQLVLAVHTISSRASPRLVLLSPRAIPRPSNVNESSTHGRLSAYPLIGGGDTAPDHGTPWGPPPTQLPPIRTIDDWIYILHTHTHEGFASLSDLYMDATCTPRWDVSGAALLRPS